MVMLLPLTLQFCSSTKKSKNTVVVPKITYIANVQPIVVGNCSPCHIPPKGQKKAFDNYDSVKVSIDEIITRIEKQPDEKGFYAV